MTTPLSTIIHGDLTLETGSDTLSHGFGDLAVANTAFINGVTNVVTDAPINSTIGGLIVSGGFNVWKDSRLYGLLTVSSTSNLQGTNINTNLGGLSVSGGNAVTIAVGSESLIQTTAGNLTIYASSGSAYIQSSNNSTNAIRILGENSGSGVNIISGQTSLIALTAGSGGIQGMTSTGTLNLSANGASASFVVNSTGVGQGLSISDTGKFDNQVLISSEGTSDTLPAIKLTSTNTAGNIVIDNFGGLGLGSVTTLTGSGGYIVTSNTGGPIQITAQASNSYFVVNSTEANQNLTIGVNGATASQLILQSAGTNATNAILVQNTNTAGSILLTNGDNSVGQVRINTGSNGLSVETQVGGGINLLSNGAVSSIINMTTATSQDLTIGVETTGVLGSKLILSNQAGGTIDIKNNIGGLDVSVGGIININTSEASNGINIGTIQNVPVKIGTSSSTTTILGNLDVRGTTTTIESTVVQVQDNILQLNSGPSGTADSGVAMKRYQSANDLGTGDVVTDTAHDTGFTLSQGVGTSTTILLESGESSTSDIYAGWWIRILAGTGLNQVRRIKTYDGASKVATIYSTADQTGVLGNPTPVEGLDLTTITDATSTYGLYPCSWILNIWDSSEREMALVCSSMVTNTDGSNDSFPPLENYVNLHINNLKANAITANTINGTLADTQQVVILTDNSTTPVSLAPPLNYGVYFVLVRPTTASNTRCHAVFAIGRLNSTVSGIVTRLIGVRGTSGEQLDIQWNASSMPSLLYRPAPGTATTTSFTIKFISV